MAEGFLPYGRQTIEDDDVEAVVRALRSDFLTTGPEVARFESMVAEAVGAKWAVAVSNGTAALHTACFAAGVGEGDRVVVPAVTFLATANCARYLGAEPMFCDVDPDSGLMSARALERLLDERPKAILPVHLNGRAADLEAIGRLASDAGAVVIEDAAHALGAGGIGSGELAIFSFHPVKHVTCGEGGAITGNDPDLEDRARSFRNHMMERREDRLTNPSPGPWYYEASEVGFNYRLTDIQAALGCSQMGKLGRFVDRRRALAARYDEALRDIDGVEPVPAGSESAYHLYAVLIDFDRFGVTRAELMTGLRDDGIGTQVHYIPLPMQPYYAKRGWRYEDFPGARRYYERVLSLPLFPAMADDDVDRVVDSLSKRLEGPK